jgi:hypothetical protein
MGAEFDISKSGLKGTEDKKKYNLSYAEQKWELNQYECSCVRNYILFAWYHMPAPPDA